MGLFLLYYTKVISKIKDKLTRVIHFWYTYDMPTIKTRLNISLSDHTRDALAKLARRERVPQATKAARLIELALEIEEDQIWDSLAQRRDSSKPRYVSHRKAWR